MLIRKHRDLSDIQVKVLRIMHCKILTTHTESQYINNNSLNFI